MREIRTLQEYQELIETETRPIFIDAYATWCGPCKAIAPFIEKLADSEIGSYVCFVKFNVEDDNALSQLLGIIAMPTFVAIANKEKCGECRGANKDAIANLIKQITAK